MPHERDCVTERRRVRITAVLLFVGALVLRLVYVRHLQMSPLAQTPMLDELYHVEWARELASGDWLGSRVFFRAPLYPYLLGVLLSVFHGSLTAARVIQACYGALVPVVTLFIARRVCGRRCGLVAGVLAAVYPFFIYFDNELLITSLIVLLDALLLLMVLRADEHPSWMRWLGAGVVMGLSAIARPNVLAFAPLIFLWVWLSARAGAGVATIAGGCARPGSFTLLNRSTPLLTAAHRFAVLIVGVVLVVVPVTLRNAALEKGFVLIASQGGINYFIGNNAQSDGVSAVVPGLGEAWEYDDCERIAERQEGRRLKASEVSAFWYARGREFLRTRPGDAVRLHVRKLVLFWDRYELANNKDIYYFGRMSGVFRGVSWLHFGVIVPLAAVGLLALVRRKRRAALLLFFVAAYSATVIAFFVNARFRMPVLPALIVFASAGLIWLWDEMRKRNWVRLAAGLVCVAVIAAFVNHDFYSTHLGDRPQTHNTIGLAHASAGRYAEAVASYDRAVELAPAYAKAWNNRGLALEGSGDRDAALASYVTASELDPLLATAPNNIGALLWRDGDLESAAVWFERAVAADAWLPEAQYNLASVLARLGRAEEAEIAYESAVRARPTFAEAWHDYGRLLEDLGRMSEAIGAYQRAVIIDPRSAEARNSLGIALARSGQYREAIMELEAALQLAPGDPNLTANLRTVRTLMQNGAP